MKLVMEERTKHRLIGLIVIVAIAVVFIPALTRQSTQRFEENVSLSVRLPQKPQLPKVMIAEEKTVFQSVKVATPAALPVTEAPRVSTLVKAEPLSGKPVALARKEPASDTMESVIAPVLKVAVVRPSRPKVPVKPVLVFKKGAYAVQLASFTQQSNAQSLVKRLRNKGYKASYNQSSGKSGPLYKVIVGELHQKDDAQVLQKRLAEMTQLNGFIIKTGVS